MANNQKGSLPPKWTDEEIAKVIIKIEREKGRIIPELLKKIARGAHHSLERRVVRGEFNSKAEAIEEIKKKFFPQWFLDLTNSDNLTDWDRAAEWIVDTANYRDPERIESLNILVEREPERVRKVRKKIKTQSKADWIVSEFEKTKEGETLRSLIEKDEELRGLIKVPVY